MIFWLVVDGYLRQCTVTNPHDCSMLVTLGALERNEQDEDIQRLIRSARENASRLIVDSGQYRIVK